MDDEVLVRELNRARRFSGTGAAVLRRERLLDGSSP